MEKKEYIKIGQASDLADKKERRLYRFLEILPGLLSWGTLGGVVFLSWLQPVWIAFFIIAFDIYWLLRTIFLTIHLRSCFNRMEKVKKTDWLEELKKDEAGFEMSWQEIYHLIILPTYKESLEVAEGTFRSLSQINYSLDKFIVVLACEEKGGEEALKIAREIEEKYGRIFFKFLTTVHPMDIPGELAGKGANETWAAREVKEKIIDPLKIPYENILVSVFDIDTVVHEQYFARLAWVFLKTADRLHSSYQPIPVFNNNIWDAPAFSRVAAQSSTFWQMMLQERPEHMITFSSHSMSFKSLAEMDFWSVKNVSEDSRIFWQALLFYDGRYKVEPLYLPVSMDANLAQSFWRTVLNVYKQHRRWAWGAENIAYALFGFFQNKKISRRAKLFWTFDHLEAFWSWATNALLICFLGWLPLALGGQKFNVTVLSYNLPQITKFLMTLTMIGLIVSAIYGINLLTPRPKNRGFWHSFLMAAQWVLLPLTIIIFGAIPGLEAQTRLMLGKYMGFWVTPKERKIGEQVN